MNILLLHATACAVLFATTAIVQQKPKTAARIYRAAVQDCCCRKRRGSDNQQRPLGSQGWHADTTNDQFRPYASRGNARYFVCGAGVVCGVAPGNWTRGAWREPSSALKYASLRLKPLMLATMLFGNSDM